MKNNKSLGQHWLYNRDILNKIADLALQGSASLITANRGEFCLEIGPGLGTLTASLLKRFDKVTAVEFDTRLAENLPGSFPGKNLEVVNEDFLKFDLSEMPKDYVVAGNIPYYITSPIIEKLLTAQNRPKRIVLLIQKEVAERILSDKESVLSLRCKNYADVYAGPVVFKGEFTPPPKVDSQVIVLEPHEPEVDETVFKLINLAFSAPRKKVIHNLEPLKGKEALKKIFSELEISEDARPADLSLRDYARLFKSMV